MDRALSDKSELDELLDNARKEKDTLESEVAHLKKQLALSKNEIEKLKEQVSILQEECKVSKFEMIVFVFKTNGTSKIFCRATAKSRKIFLKALESFIGK